MRRDALDERGAGRAVWLQRRRRLVAGDRKVAAADRRSIGHPRVARPEADPVEERVAVLVEDGGEHSGAYPQVAGAEQQHRAGVAIGDEDEVAVVAPVEI